jgi:prepilin-type N-terminal cleavage/methylation domain-containing protein
MKLACKISKKAAQKKAGAAVSPYRCRRGGFTLIEVMIVVIVIGILATLAYSSLTDLIFANRAKEAAQTIRTFTERALMDAKRQNKPVRIYVSKNAIVVADTGETDKEIAREALSQGFSVPDDDIPDIPNVNKEFFNDVESRIRIGLSGIDKEGYFAVCDLKGYCGGAVKVNTVNSFKAYIKKGTSADWEAL